MWHIVYISVVVFELALLAIATDLLAGHAGKVGVSAVSFAAIGGYSYALATTHLSISPWLALAGVCFLIIPLSLGVGRLLLNLRKNEYLLGTFVFEVSLISLFNNSDFAGGPLGVSNIPAPLAEKIKDPSISAALVLGLSLIAVILLLHNRLGVRSLWGLKLRSIRDDVRSAESLGVNIKGVILAAFAAHAVIACVAGVGATIAQSYIGPDSFGVSVCLWVLGVVYLGGTGGKSAWMLAASIIYVFLGELLALLVRNPLWVGPLQQIVFNGSLISILILRRRGLAGPPLEEGPLGGWED